MNNVTEYDKYCHKRLSTCFIYANLKSLGGFVALDKVDVSQKTSA